MVGSQGLQAKLGPAAHRRASSDHPENTLVAIAAAKTVADYVELDVRGAADRHDLPFSGRCPPQGKPVAGFVADGDGSRSLPIGGVVPGLWRYVVERAMPAL